MDPILIIIIIILFLFVSLFFITGLIFYNKTMVSNKNVSIDMIDENSHWFIFKEELQKRLKEYKKYEEKASVVSIKNKRGIELKAYLIRQNKDEIKKIVIFVHGYKSRHDIDVLYADSWMLKEGYDALLVDNEGLGESGGKRMGMGILDAENIREWIDYVNELYDNKVEIILFGISMGANAVLLNSDKELKNVKGIISDSAYTSMYDELILLLKGNKLFAFFIRLFLKIFWKRDIKTSSIDSLKNSKYPVMFIHGSLDRFVHTIFTELNFEACTSEKEKLIVGGAYHAESGLIDRDLYVKMINDFIKKYIYK